MADLNVGALFSFKGKVLEFVLIDRIPSCDFEWIRHGEVNFTRCDLHVEVKKYILNHLLQENQTESSLK